MNPDRELQEIRPSTSTTRYVSMACTGIPVYQTHAKSHELPAQSPQTPQLPGEHSGTRKGTIAFGALSLCVCGYIDTV